MSVLENVFKDYCAQMSRLLREEYGAQEQQLDLFDHTAADDAEVEKFFRALAAHALDGSETHRIIDQVLPGLENAAAAATIKAAIKSTYRNSISVDIVLELFLAFRETDGGGLHQLNRIPAKAEITAGRIPASHEG